MPASHLAALPSFQTMRGPTLIDGTDLTKFFNMVIGVNSGIVAHAGGGIPLATPLNFGFSSVDTVATAGDSVGLPPAIINGWCWVINNGSAGTTGMSIYTMQSNPNNGGVADVAIPHGSITPNAAATAVTVASGHATLFVCTALGRWKQIADWS